MSNLKIKQRLKTLLVQLKYPLNNIITTNKMLNTTACK